MNNFEIVGKYVGSKKAKGKELYLDGYAYALGSLEAQTGMMLLHLEIYHPDAYNSVVDMFDVQEGDD